MLLTLCVVLVALALGLRLWRRSDRRAADAAWVRLAGTDSGLPERFDPSLLRALPEPAQRYFAYTITPGARLAAVAEISMRGRLSLGSKDKPRDLPMQARQILASPRGFVWRLRAGAGPMQIAGSDGMDDDRSWVRFWWLGLVPVVRAGGGPDHLRAAFGRVVAETAFWAPAALLPQRGVAWQAVDADTARATVRHRGLTQTVDIRVNAEGRPLWVTIPRWTDANPDRLYRLQPFGGEFSDWREVQGCRLPFRVVGGNFFGTDDYFPFYRAEVEAIRLLPE